MLVLTEAMPSLTAIVRVLVPKVRLLGLMVSVRFAPVPLYVKLVTRVGIEVAVTVRLPTGVLELFSVKPTFTEPFSLTKVVMVFPPKMFETRVEELVTTAIVGVVFRFKVQEPIAGVRVVGGPGVVSKTYKLQTPFGLMLAKALVRVVAYGDEGAGPGKLMLPPWSEPLSVGL